MIVLEDPTRERDSDLIHRDGSLAFTGDQSLGGNKLTNVDDPTSDQDAATKAYVDSEIAGVPAELDDLADVVITSPAANQALRHNGTNWVNSNAGVNVVSTLTDGTTITIDWSLGNIFNVTLGGDRGFAFSNLTVGQCIIVHVKQDGTGTRLLGYPSSVKWGGGSAPTLTTTPGRTDTLGFECKTAGGTPAVYGRVLDLDVDI